MTTIKSRVKDPVAEIISQISQLPLTSLQAKAITEAVNATQPKPNYTVWNSNGLSGVLITDSFGNLVLKIGN